LSTTISQPNEELRHIPLALAGDQHVLVARGARTRRGCGTPRSAIVTGSA
jgi:hypothetical protein